MFIITILNTLCLDLLDKNIKHFCLRSLVVANKFEIFSFKCLLKSFFMLDSVFSDIVKILFKLNLPSRHSCL